MLYAPLKVRPLLVYKAWSEVDSDQASLMQLKLHTKERNPDFSYVHLRLFEINKNYTAIYCSVKT